MNGQEARNKIDFFLIMGNWQQRITTKCYSNGPNDIYF